MKLRNILIDLPPAELDQLAQKHVRAEEGMPRLLLCNTLDGILRSFRFLQDFILDRQPPTFAVLTMLLEAPNFALPVAGFHDAVSVKTDRICGLIASGGILYRADGLRLYRRVLYEARRNGIEIDPSESAILGVLRRELEIFHVEHFLIEHHADLQEFWKTDDAIDRETSALRVGGVIFEKDARFILPEDLAQLVQQALGIDMASVCAARLFTYLSSQELAEALGLVGARISGSKEDRIERLVTNMVQPRAVLRRVSLDTLRAVARDSGAAISGSKEDLVERIIGQFASSLDLVVPEVQIAEPVHEARALVEERFRALFCSLRGGELTDILEAFPELRQSGTKDTRAATLWASHRSEATLLQKLSNRQLEDVLARLDLKTSGSKNERVERVVHHFATSGLETLRVDDEASAQATDRTGPASPTTPEDG